MKTNGQYHRVKNRQISARVPEYVLSELKHRGVNVNAQINADLESKLKELLNEEHELSKLLEEK